LHEVFNCCRFRHRATKTGKGKSSPAAPQNRQPDGGSRSTPGLLGAPPSRGRTATCKTNPAKPLPSRRRRLDTLSKPTLYTRRPRPPAAGAAGGGRGNRRFGAGEVAGLRSLTNRLQGPTFCMINAEQSWRYGFDPSPVCARVQRPTACPRESGGCRPLLHARTPVLYSCT
jgi:hypothetical protein